MGYLALLSLGLGLLRFIAWGVNAVWGKEARLAAAVKALVEKRAAARLERDRLRAVNKKIDEAPMPEGKSAADALNDAWDKKP